MTTRAEAKAQELARHKLQALVIVIICAAVAVGYTVFLVLMATHMPDTLVDEGGVTGDWHGNVTMEWDHLVISHTSDLSMGDLDWEVARGKENETIDSGTHGDKDDELIIVETGRGKVGIYLMPSGVNSAKKYDVTVRQFYLSPSLIESLRLSGFFVLALMVPFLWFVYMASYTEKYREEYRLARIGIVMTMLLSAVFAFTPWV